MLPAEAAELSIRPQLALYHSIEQVPTTPWTHHNHDVDYCISGFFEHEPPPADSTQAVKEPRLYLVCSVLLRQKIPLFEAGIEATNKILITGQAKAEVVKTGRHGTVRQLHKEGSTVQTVNHFDAEGNLLTRRKV